MMRSVGSNGSLGAAEQGNEAGGVGSQEGRAVQPQVCQWEETQAAGGSRQGGYFDRTELVAELGLVPSQHRTRSLMVPSRSLGNLEAAAGELKSSGFSMPVQAPLTGEQFNSLVVLGALGAISRKVLVAASEQSMALRDLSPSASQPSVHSQAPGGNRSSASLADCATGSLRPAGAQVPPPAGNRMPRSQSAARLASGSGSGRATAGPASSGARGIVSASAVPTDQAQGGAGGALNVAQGNEGVNPHEERRSPWVRFKGSDYFPQRKLAYLFLGAMGFTGWWSAEVMKAATIKLQDPKQSQSLLITQMLSPLLVLALVMRAYLHMNKEKKQDDTIAAMANQLKTVAGMQDLAVEGAAARAAGPDNV